MTDFHKNTCEFDIYCNSNVEELPKQFSEKAERFLVYIKRKYFLRKTG